MLGHAVFGAARVGNVFYRLLLIMVLSSAAASTQTTILPTARTTLSMADLPGDAEVVRQDAPAVPDADGVDAGDGRYLDRALRGLQLHVGRPGHRGRGDQLGVFIATYYGLTGFTCAWYYRRNLTSSARNLWMQGILPFIGGVILWFLGGWSLYLDWSVTDPHEASYTKFTVPGLHWQVGGVVRDRLPVLAWSACIFFLFLRFTMPPFFRKQTLTRSTPTLVPDK